MGIEHQRQAGHLKKSKARYTLQYEYIIRHSSTSAASNQQIYHTKSYHVAKV